MRPTVRRRAAIAAILAASLSTVSTVSIALAEPSSTVGADEATVDDRAVIADGHVDIGPRWVDGTWTIQVRDDTGSPSVWRNLPDTVLQAADAAQVQVPADPLYAFLGAEGSTVWLLPQVQQEGILWPGWNTQDPEVATTINREVTWTLRDVQGPGHFVLFVNGDFGEPKILFDGRQPFPQETGIDVNTHVHGNWAFTGPGTYLLEIAMTGETVDGEAVDASGILRIYVGEVDPQSAFAVNPAGSAASPSGSSASGGSTASSSERAGIPLWIPIVGGLVVLAVVVVVVVRRRSSGRAS